MLLGNSGVGGLMSSSGKMNSYSGNPTTANSHTTGQYRGYSPSKPKWKPTTLGMPQTNNLVGGGLGHSGMISHV